MPPLLDVIIPVWNEPVETRRCLAALIHSVPDARFILVDNGSDRETESLLHEFADQLDRQALLFRTPRNIGLVPAVNRGLEKAEAEFTAVVRHSTVLGAGWFDAIRACAEDEPDAGLFSPSFTAERSGSPVEIARPLLAGFVLRKQALEAAGLLDEELDPHEWCLKDYTRRLFSKGFRSLRVPGASGSAGTETLFGSSAKREARRAASLKTCESRWGVETAWIVVAESAAAAAPLEADDRPVMNAARRGDSFTLLLPSSVLRKVVKAGLYRHESVRLEAVPLFGRGRLERLVERLRQETAGPVRLLGESVGGEALAGAVGNGFLREEFHAG